MMRCCICGADLGSGLTLFRIGAQLWACREHCPPEIARRVDPNGVALEIERRNRDRGR